MPLIKQKNHLDLGKCVQHLVPSDLVVSILWNRSSPFSYQIGEFWVKAEIKLSIFYAPWLKMQDERFYCFPSDLSTGGSVGSGACSVRAFFIVCRAMPRSCSPAGPPYGLPLTSFSKSSNSFLVKVTLVLTPGMLLVYCCLAGT